MMPPPTDPASYVAGTAPCPSYPTLNSFDILLNFMRMPGPSRLKPNSSLCVSNISLDMDNIITIIPKLSIDIVPCNLIPRDKKMMEKEMFGGL